MNSDFAAVAVSSHYLPHVPGTNGRLQGRRDRAAVETLATIRALAEDPERPVEIRRMAEYIHEYLFDPALDFQGVIASARSSDLDAGGVALLFAEHTGEPPMPFIDSRRLDVARQLSRHDDLSLVQVSALAGFPNLQAFFRAARQRSLDDVSRAVQTQLHREAGRGSHVDAGRLLAELGSRLNVADIHTIAAFLLEHFPVGDAE